MLSWSDPERIAYALWRHYPRVSRVGLTPDDIFDLILNIPQGYHFSPLSKPSERVLEDILWRWMRYAQGDGFTVIDQFMHSSQPGTV